MSIVESLERSGFVCKSLLQKKDIRFSTKNIFNEYLEGTFGFNKPVEAGRTSVTFECVESGEKIRLVGDRDAVQYAADIHKSHGDNIPDFLSSKK